MEGERGREIVEEVEKEGEKEEEEGEEEKGEEEEEKGEEGGVGIRRGVV